MLSVATSATEPGDCSSVVRDPRVSRHRQVCRFEADPGGPERCQALHERHVIGAVDPRQLERGKIALQPLDFGDISRVGQALQAIGGEDDNRRRPGEVGQVKNVRQRRDDERVETLFGERGANRLMTAFKRFTGRVRHGWRRATPRAPRQSVSRDRQGSGPAYHRRGLAWRRPVGAPDQRQPQRSRRAQRKRISVAPSLAWAPALAARLFVGSGFSRIVHSAATAAEW